MSEVANDRWTIADAYEAYMGRFSRPLAREFIAWLAPRPLCQWLEVGCGTGALTTAIAELCQPASVLACDTSQAFVDYARNRLAGSCAFHVVAGADTLPSRDGGFDMVVSGLLLNFMPEPARALATMRQRVRPGGTVAAYIWDYAGGVEFLQYFWEEAVASDSAAQALDEAQRFGDWRPLTLASLFRSARLLHVETAALEIATEFENFAAYWTPFLGGTGPAPSYVASLSPPQRERLRARLEQRLVGGRDRPIRLRARATVVRGVSR